MVLLEQIATREEEMLDTDRIEAMISELTEMMLKLDADYPA